MERKIYRTLTIVPLLLLHFHCWGCMAAPLPAPQNDIDDVYSTGGGVAGGSVDYNSVMGHFKDFFMYLPVMMATLKETMSGFPKFAEGVRILTSKSGRSEDDCNCKRTGGSNEIENNSRYG